MTSKAKVIISQTAANNSRARANIRAAMAKLALLAQQRAAK